MTVSEQVAEQALGIRIATRTIVRELGFMKRYLAGTDLTVSQAHALLELQTRPQSRAAELAHVLRLDKSAISRLVDDLVHRGYILRRRSREDRRATQLALSAEGRRVVEIIQRRADRQIVDALQPMPEVDRSQILKGLTLYADALRMQRKPSRVADHVLEAEG